MAGMLRRILIPLAILMNVLGCWVHWEAVVKPLLDKCGWPLHKFPSPFYLFYAPHYFWHDLAYLLIVVGTLILGYYAIKNSGGEKI